MGTHRELSKRSLRAKKRPVRAKNGQLERKKGQFERKNGQVERKSAFKVPSGLPKNFKSARTRQLRASKSVMRAAKGRRSPKPPKPFSVISRWIRFLVRNKVETFLLAFMILKNLEQICKACSSQTFSLSLHCEATYKFCLAFILVLVSIFSSFNLHNLFLQLSSFCVPFSFYYSSNL